MTRRHRSCCARCDPVHPGVCGWGRISRQHVSREGAAVDLKTACCLSPHLDRAAWLHNLQLCGHACDATSGNAVQVHHRGVANERSYVCCHARRGTDALRIGRRRGVQPCNPELGTRSMIPMEVTQRTWRCNVQDGRWLWALWSGFAERKHTSCNGWMDGLPPGAQYSTTIVQLSRI